MNTPPRPVSSRTARGTALTAAAAAGCLLVAGCSGSGKDEPDADRAGAGRLKIALISHGNSGDAFWDLVRRGAEAAAAKDGVELTYASDSDAAGQAELVRSAIRTRTDGIAVTLAKPDAMRGPVGRARAAGIPVVALNSGMDAWQSEGALEYFGQDESVAGRAVGDKLDDLKARHALCVIHERGNVSLEARCAGVKKTFAGKTDMLYVDGADMNAVDQALTTELRQDPSVDEVVTNGAQFALAAVKAVKTTGAEARVATFDLNKDLVKAVQGGAVQFAVDQQPYLQGYLAVDAPWLYKTNGNTGGGGVAPVLTGPAFVTRANVAAVARFAANGTR
ncbi:substrate-binding domain-containing protein [Streptomyces brasiliensis]|uniref:Sugar ABC transporter substrate-binding protein n=1 Tax=Streptomyces brasiliensis TaxID=1954 RepID=A0A917K2D9_9ACTN|nr:substrate-binding domain-containing protein [Streptomyces brasiliensis]GGI96022.1 sugar ABC transporter substrate-binding protein [Streptomyces brasiliensis]